MNSYKTEHREKELHCIEQDKLKRDKQKIKFSILEHNIIKRNAMKPNMLVQNSDEKHHHETQQ